MRNTVTRQRHRSTAAFLIACSVLLAGCASKERAPYTVFDFGSLTPVASQAPAAPRPSAIVVMDVTGPNGLDTERMFYRLDYADARQARTYAGSRWNASPADLVTQRIKARLAQAGVKVLSATDAATGVPILRIEIDEFMHTFGSPAASEGRVVLRASVFQEHRLVDQRSFRRNAPAPSQDAAGGVEALAAGTDQVAADLLAWLASLDTQGK